MNLHKWSSSNFWSDALASDPTGAHVGIILMQISLNIDFTGIHAVGILFSIKFYETRPQYEISMTMFQNSTLNGFFGHPV